MPAEPPEFRRPAPAGPDPRQPGYDAIVTGAGAGGLTTALTLAQQGARTLVLEKNPYVGGYAHGDGEQGFRWDHGGHVLLGYRLGMPTRRVFERLGIDRRIAMVPDLQTFQCVFPDERTEIPADLTTAAERLSEQYPAERDGITRLLLVMERMVADLDVVVPSFRIADHPGERRLLDGLLEQFQRPWLGDAVAPLAGRLRLPGHTLLTYQTRTLQQLLDEHLRDPALKATLSMLCVGIGTAPSELSAVIASVFLVHALRPMWMPEGGFGRLAEVLRAMFLEAGGTIVTGAEVERVLVTGGRVHGVRTVDGREYRARAVVCASDARRLYTEQLPAGVVPRRLRSDVGTAPTTPAFFQVQLGIDTDLAEHAASVKRLNFVYPHRDIDKAMANFPLGNVEEAAYYLYVATFHQPELAPTGMHSIKLECPTRLDSVGIDWDRDKDAIADVFIRRTEELIPDLRRHVVVRRVVTPLDMARRTNNSDGAFAGWAFVPQMLTRGRPQQRSPLPGLYLAGHWTTPAAGLPWVVLSGYNTAGMVLADAGGHPRWAH
ncbi:phytoene desaturase family protein [Geodermatophilus marinus]|uniref:phytoene desaturase family protein n=1 Tax=Geodermatophilus sp. LHW52908 TaxID=2303986 RepID=UPI000E3E713D|nr:NAD(P)/FAD-dependent oxidoreductase [Geodermatophilus sp. LHW52908]RFU22490.1 NAD(P)/FAD-dependent oxidoreductase [Geodermatophilus sp. LHW52908]